MARNISRKTPMRKGPQIPLVPAQAGTQCFAKSWIPAFAGMSGVLGNRRKAYSPRASARFAAARCSGFM